MAITNRERVSKGMDLLFDGLRPYVEREMKAVYKARWIDEIDYTLERPVDRQDDGSPSLDTSALLKLMMWRWREVFSTKLGHVERSIVSELLDSRNRWAHQDPFSGDDTYRVLDSIYRLLSAISASQATEVDAMKQEALRVRFDDQARQVRRRKSTGPSVESTTGAAGLTPWRDIMTPHADVSGGNFRQAEFAADLSQVHAGRADDTYQNPRNFFQRTYLTQGLQTLLMNGLNVLHDHAGGKRVGNPIIKLQTNFGGGKTHSMLALYHLFSDAHYSELLGVDALLTKTGIDQPAQARRAVLVGTALSPGEPHRTPDGTVINTLWGELAWQLLGAKGYELVAESDRKGTNPGSRLLGELFYQAEPSLILIDEWVAFLRQLYNIDGLPAGSFDANLSFAQSLAEAVVATPGTLLVASLPASDIEVGGQAGREALQRLEHTFHRFESIWRPAGTEESYEIVRRRLFEETTDPDLLRKRDAVIQEMMAFYRKNRADFPSEVSEESYRRSMEAAYPVHPELFERLNEDWGSLDKFQRTRGVLRLMSSVIHVLWERGDNSPLITPGTMPLDHADVREELLHYLDLGWHSVVEKDVDGEGSLPVIIDQENPSTLGRFAAARRVARTIFMGSAPISQAANRGIDERRIRLGAAQPGENPALFGDALRRLRDRATYLYVDGDRHWYSTQPTVTRLAQDRAQSQTDDAIDQEIIRRLRQAARTRADFHGIHVAPSGGADVPDERETRLVVLDPDHPWGRKDLNAALVEAEAILESRGSGPRIFKNTLIFLAADEERLISDLEPSVRQYLAWKSIEEDRESLNLDQFQTRQAANQLEQADNRVHQQIPETYRWLIVPDQPEPTGKIDMSPVRLTGSGSLAERASRKLINDNLMVENLGGVVLRKWLDEIPLWKGNHVSVRELQDYFAQYVYLSRLRDPSVLMGAIAQGVGQLTWHQDGFAYAERWDPESERYQGLTVQQNIRPVADGHDLVVKPEAAQRQIDAERKPDGDSQANGKEAGEGRSDGYDPRGGSSTRTIDPPPAPARFTRFHGSVEIEDNIDFIRKAGQIGEAVITHLEGQSRSKVRVSIEIEADLPAGAEEQLRRTVTENARTLGFTSFGFEKE